MSHIWPDDGCNGSEHVGPTRRQVFRLLNRCRQDGASAIRHKARGKPPNNRIQHAKRDYALSLIKESYADLTNLGRPHQQRVTHAAITENKHVLAHIKEEQDKAAPPKVKPVIAKNGYKKTGCRPPGRPSKMEAYTKDGAQNGPPRADIILPAPYRILMLILFLRDYSWPR